MILLTSEQVNDTIAKLSEEDLVIVDIESSGLEMWLTDELCGLGLYLPKADLGVYIPVRHKTQKIGLLDFGEDEETENVNHVDYLRLLDALSDVNTLVGHNLKFDLIGLTKDGFKLKHRIEDTLNLARLYFKEKYDSLSLENCVKVLLNIDEDFWKAAFKQYLDTYKIENYSYADVTMIANYCITDCKNTYKIYEKLIEYIKQTEQTEIREKEQNVLRVAWNMEHTGLVLDMDYLQQCKQNLIEAKAIVMHKLALLVDSPIDPNSNQSVTQIMTKLGIKSKKIGKSGQPSWDADSLQKIDHPIANLIALYRTIDKRLGTYFEPYEKSGGVLHCTFKTWGPITGRFSCVNPNLQQVPVNQNWSEDFALTEDLSTLLEPVQVRKLFIPPQGYSWLSIDFKQMEILVYADYLEDERLREKLNSSDIDFHTLTAQMVYSVSESDEKFSEYRTMAKSISLGLIFGMGIKRLAAKLSVSEALATEYRNKYFKAFPTASKFLYAVKNRVQSRGWIKNRFGRRYYLSEDRSYAGVNYLVQGTSADIVKTYLIKLHELFEQTGSKSKVVLQIHDEFNFFIENSEFDWIVPQIHNVLKEPLLKTFLPVDLSIGNPSWGEKIKICSVCYKNECKC